MVDSSQEFLLIMSSLKDSDEVFSFYSKDLFPILLLNSVRIKLSILAK